MVVDDVPEGKTTSSRIDAPVKELPTGPRANGNLAVSPFTVKYEIIGD